MASSLKSTLPAGRALVFGPRRSPPAPDLVLAPPPRSYAQAHRTIPGTAAAYVWLAAGLLLAAFVVAFALWLVVGLTLERAAVWSAGRTI